MNNVYSNFLENLYNESPRAAYALESMKYSLMSQTGLDEAGALEVVSKLVVAKATQPAHEATSTALVKEGENV